MKDAIFRRNFALELAAVLMLTGLVCVFAPFAQSQTGSGTPEWAWMGGNNSVPPGKGQPGVYGTQYQFAPSNAPGGRNWGALSWTDRSGRLWLFGGFGYDASGTAGYLGDLWVFDPSQGADGEWAWMGGSSTLSTNSVGYAGQPAVYGTEYQFAASNFPGGRNVATRWTDASGRFWLYGGQGFDASGTFGALDDLWVFDPSQGTYGEWAWMGGSSTALSGYDACGGLGSGAKAVYGTEYQFAASNYPGYRGASLTWADQGGKLWLYGGGGCDSAGFTGDMNDVWVFDPSQGAHGEWAWMGGSDLQRASGIYGTEYQFAASNAPGARDSAVGWVDTNGRLWLFGGYGFDSAGTYSELNDMWLFDPSQGSNGEWAWMGGSEIARATGAYGTKYQFANSNVPGSRDEAMSWKDQGGKLWLFGGLGYDSLGHYGYLNDLWVFNPYQGPHGEWAWMEGSGAIPPGAGNSGIYGTEYQYAVSSAPGGRNAGATWVEPGGKLWLFGGEGYDSLGNNGLLNDLWELEVPNLVVTPSITWPAPAPITYGTALSAAQLDATANVPGTFSYSPAAGTVLTAATQQLTMIFTPTDTTDYTTATATVQLTVNKATPVVSWSSPTAITYGAALSGAQLNATASVPGTFAYSPSAGTTLTAGVHSLNVTFTPTDSTDYTTATATVQLTVNKATPVITWPTPAPIAYGTALSSAQLDASAIVPGTFAYTPAAGTILPAGTNTLSAVFTPSDTADYTTANATVILVVNPPPSYTLSASPSSLSIKEGSNASSTISVNASNGFSGAVSLSISGLPKGVTSTFSPNPATKTSAVTVTVSNSASPGNSVLTITGKSGSLVQTTTITLSVVRK